MMRGLRLCLVILGLLCLLSVLGVFLPLDTLDSLAKRFGAGDYLRQAPPFVYCVRIMSATFTAIGVYLLLLARDPLRYGGMVPMTGVAAIWIGGCCLAFGILSGLGVLWFLPDAASSVVFGVLILIFYGRALGEAGAAAGEPAPAVGTPAPDADAGKPE